ncbi:hypothetical protein LX32DRAFT_336973 [Colletotrichum zoysiae]|uniref:Uncharacterized protein n=1 Tax=Colletotrichum zoysiae TaxID=1216348 RepID=A0AAD9HL89_9PEZI|nr:hypothetical protein LX32DRAFT_336973 [Colletotrichum zoysiae]
MRRSQRTVVIWAGLVHVAPNLEPTVCALRIVRGVENHQVLARPEHTDEAPCRRPAIIPRVTPDAPQACRRAVGCRYVLTAKLRAGRMSDGVRASGWRDPLSYH